MSCGGGGGDGAALRAAASAGDAAACNRLLGSLRSVRFTRDELGRSALHLAASAGHKNVVRQLLNVAAPREVDSPDGAGCTALQRAAADGHEEVVRLLLSRGADVDRQDSVVCLNVMVTIVYATILFSMATLQSTRRPGKASAGRWRCWRRRARIFPALTPGDSPPSTCVARTVITSPAGNSCWQVAIPTCRTTMGTLLCTQQHVTDMQVSLGYSFRPNAG